MDEDLVAQVRAAVNEAFLDVSPPDIAIGRFVDLVFGDFPEAPIHGVKSWRDLNLDVLEGGPHGARAGILSLFRGATWRHYLPAYLLLALEPEERASDMALIVLSTIGPQPRGTSHWDDRQDRIGGLTASQKRAVSLWVALISSRSDDLAAFAEVRRLWDPNGWVA